ncbi:hypothetical protein LOTGIDRAFT_228074 [Lottia gigantea]|uniref:Myeloid leukemia factor 1 n=1 Tax=Lottia gigantea TaxID=225164 RepID=V4CSK9_LOTGI|nr:hypothetical protein LOTGIDRAFT_228074 [Lottia gigantea]ESP05525.1 hypothetical protein LOTGIDRAFT_228074 [Lottia gigantea]
MRGDDAYDDFWSSYRRPFGHRSRFHDGHTDDVFGNVQEEMRRSMEDMNRQMEDAFRNFGSGRGFNSHFDNDRRLSALDDGFSSHSPGDAMLKYDRRFDVPAIPDHRPRRSLFNGMFNSPSRWERDFNVPSGESGTYSCGKSYTMFSISDGNNKKFEERRTIRNPDGTEEEEVVRNLNDRSHVTRTTTDKYGRRETNERLNNLDDVDLMQFQREWNETNRQPYTLEDVRGDELVPRTGRRSILDRWFR